MSNAPEERLPTLEDARRIIDLMPRCHEFTTVDFIQEFDGREYRPGCRRNARIGKFLSDHKTELGIVLVESDRSVRLAGGKTTTAVWQKG